MTTVLLSGYAKLPANVTSSKLYDQFVVVVTVNMSTGVVLDADCTLSTELSRRFISGMIRGYNMEQGIDHLIGELDKKFYGNTKRAVCTALKMVQEKYGEAKAAERRNGGT